MPKETAMKKCLILFFLICLPLFARAEEAVFSLSMPEVVTPYAPNTIAVHVPAAGMVTVTAEDAYISHRIYGGQTAAGDMEIAWDGLIANSEAPGRGMYTLRAEYNGQALETPFRVGKSAAALQYCIPSDDVIYTGRDGYMVHYLATAECLLHIQLAEADAPEQILKTWSREMTDSLPHYFAWNGLLNGSSVPPGQYTLTFSVKNSPQTPFVVPVRVTDGIPEQLPVAVTDPALFLPEDEDSVWDCLMQPITVVNIGLLQHQNILAAPQEGSAIIGTLHGMSHGVMVQEVLDNGYARIGTWRQEDGDYVEGYVPARKLLTVKPNPHFGLVVDKNSQTMTVWQDGERLGTIQVSTGLMAPGKIFRETLAGAFLTTDRMISFKDEGYQYNYAIRIDGGNLIHSLGCKLDGVKFNYTNQLKIIGSKASHGCVRTDPRPGEGGLNIYWLWTHLPYNTKVLVLDDPEDRAARMAALMPTAAPTAVPVTPSPAPSPTLSPSPTATPSPTPVSTPTPAPTATAAPAFDGLLSAGSKGLRVMQLQERLRELGYYDGLIDGRFGSQTHGALTRFQKDNGLQADGILGQKTYNALYSPEADAAGE